MTMPLLTVGDLEHVDSVNLAGRAVLLMPLWDGENWKLWAPGTDGNLLELSVVDAARSQYLAKSPARDDDVVIPFIEFLWQHASWPKVAREIMAISDDIHLMATSAAKLEHFFAHRADIPDNLVSSFVSSEVEHIIIVCRSIFDLLQAAIAHMWNDNFQLIDPEAERLRRQRGMPSEFSRIVLQGENLRSADEVMARYGMPQSLAECYVRQAAFFLSLRSARNGIIHFGTGVDTIFVTDSGFCVDSKGRHFRNFAWQPEHHFNDAIVSLMPWVADVVLGTLDAAEAIVRCMASQFAFPPAVSPEYSIFLRDPSNTALRRLLEAAEGERIWWGDPPLSGGSVGGGA